jgi:hypothetical protein
MVGIGKVPAGLFAPHNQAVVDAFLSEFSNHIGFTGAFVYDKKTGIGDRLYAG